MRDKEKVEFDVRLLSERGALSANPPVLIRPVSAVNEHGVNGKNHGCSSERARPTRECITKSAEATLS